MKRFSLDDNPRQRKRLAPATGFLTNVALPRTSLSTFLELEATPPFTFVCNTPSVQANVLRAEEQRRKGGEAVLLNGVLSGLGAEKLSEAFKRPFHGVALEDLGCKGRVEAGNVAEPIASTTAEALPEADGNLSPTDPEQSTKSAKPSISDRIRKLWNDHPILPWKFKWRERFLDEYLRVDGRAEALGLEQCPGCGQDGFPGYRCEDCRGADLCKDCIVHWHRYAPLHKIERFNERLGFYERANGADVGIRLQLLHRPGEVCKFRSLHTVENCTVIHTNGIHKIPVDFCKCELGRDIPNHIQLMRWRLWPATCENPRTATTFEALDLFTRLSVLGRLNIYDFHRALEAATDGAMLKGIACVRQQLSDCARQFRHILMFKRAGRGHEPGGIAGTPPGACAIRCPACPNLDLNVPKDWALSPFRWLYRLVLALDANFRLSNKKRSTAEKDPNLTDGRAYMAPWDDYAAHVAETDKELAEVSTCSKFSALEMANSRGGKGQRSTGVAACVCARHEFVQPLGVAPLRKGERYETVDWVLCGALSYARAAEVTISYDVVCQYCKKLGDRLARIPPVRVIWAGAQAFMKLAETNCISYVVPKFHIYAHKAYCQLRYAFGWLFGTAVIDGEAPERLWSGVNAAASSLREMGPGGNNDTMDDIFGAWNWQKTCRIGTSLCERMDRALDEGDIQCDIHTEFTEALRAEQPDKLVQEEERIVEWDNGDKTKMADSQCPYYSVTQHLSTAQIKLQSEEGKASIMNKEAHDMADEDVALANCLSLGLEIEKERARIRMEFDDEGGANKQVNTSALGALSQSISAFRAEQEQCMPTTSAVLTDVERNPDAESAMTIQLCLPSSPPDGDSSLVSPQARAVEAKLRWEGMADELEGLIHQLRLKGCLYKHRIVHSTGQYMATRALSAQAAVNANIKTAADAYRRHRAAYLSLKGKGSWEDTMRELDDADCRCMGDKILEHIENMSHKRIADYLRGGRSAEAQGGTRYKLSWLWYNWTAASDTGINEELMAEWAKSRARAQHWAQEVRLVDAEMQRVIDFNESMAQIWDVRRDCQATVELGDQRCWARDAGWADGVRAYASKQAFIRRSQAERWRQQFAPLRTEARRFLTVHTEEGISLDPATLLPADEIDDMKRLIAARRERRKKRKSTEEKEVESGPVDEVQDEGEEPAVVNAVRKKGKGTRKVTGAGKGQRKRRRRAK
ncbi:unnamed protein product [Peniophora sp. CBMAI 1063]|nr:unnamed protein product [Peniophora sp. CBMAI 1063]